MAAAGSVIGSFTTEWISRKGGEAGLQKRVSRRRFRYVQKRVQRHAGLAIALASMAPPGFPFTPVIIVAAAMQYPRAKLLGLVAVFRLVRFTGEGLLAIRFGKGILKVAESPVVQGVIIAVVVISIAGSAYSIYSWVKSSKQE